MKIAAFTLGFAQLLGIIAAQEWRVLSYTGLQCNGELLDTQSPLVQPAQDSECRPLECPVQTSSLSLVIGDDNVNTWVFSFFGTEDGGSCLEEQDEAGSDTCTWSQDMVAKSFTDLIRSASGSQQRVRPSCGRRECLPSPERVHRTHGAQGERACC